MPNKINSQEEGLVLSADSKPRLKWTHQLHERFVDAVSQMGGADKATPKSVMRVMGVPGLTLYHLKSHLQKYRLAKTRDTTVNNEKQESADVLASKCRLAEDKPADETSHPQFNGSMLQMQLEVEKRLQEHMEVQKHLQLRIEAQGKYLQSVLRKAQETLAIYSSNSYGLNEAGPELSELVSSVENECLGSSYFHPSFVSNRAQTADCSVNSCLTSIDRTEIKSSKQETSECSYDGSAESNEINANNDRTDFMDQITGIQMMNHMQQKEHGSAVTEEIDLNK